VEVVVFVVKVGVELGVPSTLRRFGGVEVVDGVVVELVVLSTDVDIDEVGG